MLPLLPFALLAAQFAPDGGVAVVTTDGLWLVDPNQGLVYELADATTFGLPGGLEQPTVTWVPDSDSLLVTTRDAAGPAGQGALFRVELGPFGTLAGLTDLTHTVSVSPPPLWVDVDVSRGLDTAFLLDSSGRVFALADPAQADGSALGLFAHSAILEPRSVAVDAAKWPLGAVVLGRIETRRLQAGGSSKQLTNATDDGQWRDVEANPVTAEVYHANADDDEFGKLAGGLIASGNSWGPCVKPVKGPSDLEWDAGKNKYIVLASEGVDCLFNGAAQGWPNHVVRMPFAQIVGPGPLPPGAEPALITPPGDTGITGADGDLALIRLAAPDTTYFGAAGVAGSGQLPKFDNAGYGGGLRPGKTVFVQLKHAPAQASALLALGFQLAPFPFHDQLVYPSLELLVPAVTDAAGRATVQFLMPQAPALVGQPVFMQWWVDDVTTPAAGDLVGSHGAIGLIDD